jgi:hypothetical protein
MTELGELFPYTAIYLLQELISPIVTPFILFYSLRPKAPQIIDFFRNFTVDVVGVGDVCSFAQVPIFSAPLNSSRLRVPFFCSAPFYSAKQLIPCLGCSTYAYSDQSMNDNFFSRWMLGSTEIRIGKRPTPEKEQSPPLK